MSAATVMPAASPTRRPRKAAVLDVEAFLTSIDPLPHLPAQPTLHDDLGTEPATTTVVVDRDTL
jgi:hypothetical protein